jgi:hypothetical protein
MNADNGANGCGDGGRLSGRAEQIQHIGHVTYYRPTPLSVSRNRF